MAQSPELPLFARARDFGTRVAITASEGQFTYADLLEQSGLIANPLLGKREDLKEARVALLAPAGFHYVAAQWGIWRAGGVVVPLAVSHPPAELAHVIRDADPEIILVHDDLAERVDALEAAKSRRVVKTTRALAEKARGNFPALGPERRAMMVYTSGTTGRPKGAVSTHRNLQAQVTSLIDAWEWVNDDSTALVLPLHHVHGIVNVLTCALWAGARCAMMPKFDAVETWSRIAEGGFTLFMAVPTIYQRLIGAWEAATRKEQEEWSAAAKRMRLFVSGSAALPLRTFQRWKEISGHLLLERYGMTEIGMALGNPLRGQRRAGSVGIPFPGVEVRLADEAGAPVKDGESGEIEVRGPTVFQEYWRSPSATSAAFRDGWFRTGDIGVIDNGYYRILGRKNIDIIKTGGYKVSALEIEDVLRTHPDIAECAVVGVQDTEWGERICVAVELHGGRDLTLEELRQWAKERLAPYKTPRDLRCVRALPRNAMGKVIKPGLAELFSP